MHPPASPLLVACLCAAWCGSCREYRATFDAVAAVFGGDRFVWIDIEDESDVVDPVEVENFPTLLIASGDLPLFFGPLTPQRETLTRLVQACADGPRETAGLGLGHDIVALLARVRATIPA